MANFVNYSANIHPPLLSYYQEPKVAVLRCAQVTIHVPALWQMKWPFCPVFQATYNMDGWLRSHLVTMNIHEGWLGRWLEGTWALWYLGDIVPTLGCLTWEFTFREWKSSSNSSHYSLGFLFHVAKFNPLTDAHRILWLTEELTKFRSVKNRICRKLYRVPP